MDIGGEGIIIPLDWHFVVYPGGAGVEEGASAEEGGPLLCSIHMPLHLHSTAAGGGRAR